VYAWQRAAEGRSWEALGRVAEALSPSHVATRAVEHLVNRRRATGESPPVSLVNLLTLALATGWDLEGATRLVEDMPESLGIQPDPGSYSALAHGCLVNGNVDAVFGLAKLQHAAGLLLDSRSHASLARACLLRGDLEGAQASVRDMCACGSEPDHALLSAFGAVLREDARRALDEGRGTDKGASRRRFTAGRFLRALGYRNPTMDGTLRAARHETLRAIARDANERQRGRASPTTSGPAPG